MVLALRKSPQKESGRYIGSAKDLLLCRDSNGKCDIYQVAVLFDRYFASRRGVAPRNVVPSRDDMSKNPLLLSGFLLKRAQRSRSDSLKKAPLELFDALAMSYHTLGTENAAHMNEVGPFIKTCFSRIPADVKIVPVSDSQKITNVAYWEPRLTYNCKKTRGELSVAEQCDFEIRSASDRKLWHYARLNVEYGVVGLEGEATLFTLRARKVEVSLMDRDGHELPEASGGKCTWHDAHSMINVNVYDPVCSKKYNGSGKGLGKGASWRADRRSTALMNAAASCVGGEGIGCNDALRTALTKLKFSKTNEDVVGGVLSALLGKPKDELPVTYGQPVVSKKCESGLSYRVQCRVLIRAAEDKVYGAEVRYGVRRNSCSKPQASLSLYSVHISDLHASADARDKFLSSGFDGKDKQGHSVITLGQGMVLRDRKLLTNTKRLRGGSSPATEIYDAAYTPAANGYQVAATL